MTTGARQLVGALRELRVDRVFGIPGAQDLEFFDELSVAGIRVLLPACERGAAFAACGWGSATGRPAVLTIVPGAGLTHALSGIAEAFVDQVPMVVVVCGIRDDLPWKYQLHEMDQAAVVRPVAKAVFQVSNQLDPAAALRKAWAAALGPPPGPAVVEVPANRLMQQVGGPSGEAGGELPWEQAQGCAAPEPAQLEAAAAVLKGAGRLGIYAGAGAMAASERLVRLARAWGAPVATTMSGRGVIPEDHALACGFGCGPGGTRAARELIAGCDTLLVVGARFAEVATASFGLPRPERLVHIDADPQAIGRNVRADAGVVADAEAALAALEPLMAGWSAPRAEGVEESIASLRPEPAEPAQDGPAQPAWIFERLRERFPRNTVLALDSGSHTFWSAEAWKVFAPRTFLAPVDYSSMGYGVPAAVGAKCALDRFDPGPGRLAGPGHPVLAVVGDGGFRMSCMELVEAAAHGYAPQVVVFADAAYGMIAHGQRAAYGRETAVSIAEPDYEALAAAFGMRYGRVECDLEAPGVFDDLFGGAAAGEEPALVEVRLDRKAVPPYLHGALSNNRKRLPLGEKLRFVGRRVKRFFTK